MSDDYDTNVDAKVEDRINAGNSGDEVRGNEISKNELTDISTENILDEGEERSAKPTGHDLTKADDELDRQVEEVVAADPGQKR